MGRSDEGTPPSRTAAQGSRALPTRRPLCHLLLFCPIYNPLIPTDSSGYLSEQTRLFSMPLEGIGGWQHASLPNNSGVICLTGPTLLSSSRLGKLQQDHPQSAHLASLNSRFGRCTLFCPTCLKATAPKRGPADSAMSLAWERARVTEALRRG